MIERFYLTGKKFSDRAFTPVVRRVGRALGLTVREQVNNEFPPAYETGYRRQLVDYALYGNATPEIFLELESLDRAQLTTFADPPVDPENNSLNKLWFYYVTLAERYRRRLRGPQFFAFLLILPDEPVGYYHIWDTKKDYQFFDPSIEARIRANPFKFYNRRIKGKARQFLLRKQKFPRPPGLEHWTWKKPAELGHLCELVIFTATRRKLIMSRGRDLFAPEKEVSRPLLWRAG